MSTVTIKGIVDTIIQNKGYYDTDPRVVKIVEYNNMFNGGVAWGLVYADDDPMMYENSPAVLNPRTIWEVETSQ